MKSTIVNRKSKISQLPLKLAILVIVIFGLLVTGIVLWTPDKIENHTGKLRSDDINARRNAPGMPAQPASNKIRDRITPPDGFKRVAVHSGSFGEYLRNLDLKPGRPPVLLYNGEKKHNQDAHYAVIDMDVGKKNLQQCADAVIRLRAEYLYQAKRFEDIHFNFTSGDCADFTEWAGGFRPVVNGNSVTWKKKADPDSSYKSFRKYLETVFMYAGTASLAKELNRTDIKNVHTGDVFIRGGFPGHAVVVVDMAEDVRGSRVFLLAQSYMPAQDIHILKNPADSKLSPWYRCDFSGKLPTPEWEFSKNELYRFR